MTSRKSFSKALVGLLVAALCVGASARAAAGADASVSKNVTATAVAEKQNFPGMDEAVNGKMAEEAGSKPRDPYINLEAMGDLWNFVLLFGGGAAGFVVGRYWHLLFVKKEDA